MIGSVRAASGRKNSYARAIAGPCQSSRGGDAQDPAEDAGGRRVALALGVDDQHQSREVGGMRCVGLGEQVDQPVIGDRFWAPGALARTAGSAAAEPTEGRVRPRRALVELEIKPRRAQV